jgi:phosphopantothenoylcysteine synthetase/decarboxylase
LEQLTGYPVRTEFRKPDDPEPGWPMADAILVAPATINTVCKWAAGIADNLVLSMLFECMGVDVPIVVAPNVNPALARHPAFQRSVTELRSWGVRVLYERSALPPVWMASWERIMEELPP